MKNKKLVQEILRNLADWAKKNKKDSTFDSLLKELKDAVETEDDSNPEGTPPPPPGKKP